MSKRIYTTQEAAAELGVTEGRIRQLIREGVISAEKFGKSNVITQDSINAAKRRKRKPGPSPQERKPGRPRKG